MASTEITKARMAALPDIDRKTQARLLQKSVDDHTSGDPNTVFLNFSGKKGRYELGREKQDVEGALAIVDPRAAEEGWTCWKSNKVVARHRWSVYAPGEAVKESELSDQHGPFTRDQDGWAYTRGTKMLMDGETKVLRVSYETNAISAINVLGAVESLVADRWLHDDLSISDRSFPIIELGSEQFEAQGNTNYKPVFSVIAWATEEECQAYIDGQVASIDDLVAQIEEALAKPAPAPAEEEGKAPVRRGRRRAA